MLRFKVSTGMRATLFTLFLLLNVAISACAPTLNAAPPDATPAASTTGGAVRPAAPAASATAAATSAAPATADNSQTVRLEFVSGDTVARYLVREQLARISFPSGAIR